MLFIFLIQFTITVIDDTKKQYNQHISSIQNSVTNNIVHSFTALKLLQQNILNNLRNITNIYNNKEKINSASLNQQGIYISIHDPYGELVRIDNYIIDDLEQFLQLTDSIIYPIIYQNKKENIYGFYTNEFGVSNHFAYARKLNNGNIAVVHIKKNIMLDIRKSVGIGAVFKDIAALPSIHWICLEDKNQIIAAANIPQGIKPLHKNQLKKLTKQNFILTPANEVLFELNINQHSYGIIRLKLTNNIKNIIQQKIINIGLVFIVVIILILLFIRLYFSTKKNQIMAERIHQSKREVAIGNLASQTAHQFRNPLNSIMLGIQRIQRKLKNNKEISAIAETVYDQSSRLSNMITRVVQFGKPPAINLKKTDLSKTITEICIAEHPIAKKNKIKFQYDIQKNIFFNADADRIKEAVGALIHNAFEACEPQDSVSVNMQHIKKNVTITISDTGNGISNDFSKKMFDLYETEKPNGTGLGLAMALRIAKAHNGDIVYKKNNPKGAIFILQLEH